MIIIHLLSYRRSLKSIVEKLDFIVPTSLVSGNAARSSFTSCQYKDEIIRDIEKIPGLSGDIRVHLLLLNLVHRLQKHHSLDAQDQALLNEISTGIYQSYGGKLHFDSALSDIAKKKQDTFDSIDGYLSLTGFVCGFVDGAQNSTSMSTYYLIHTSPEFSAGYLVGGGARIFSSCVSSTNRRVTNDNRSSSNGSGKSQDAASGPSCSSVAGSAQASSCGLGAASCPVGSLPSLGF